MTQQPPPNQQGGYYHSQYSQQQQPAYPPPQQPAYPPQPPPPPQPEYPQQPAYGQQSPPYSQQYPQQPPPADPQPYQPAQPYSPQPYQSAQPYSPQPYQSAQPYSPQPQPGYGGGQPPYGDQPGYFPGGESAPPPRQGSKKLVTILGSIGGVAVLAIGGFVLRNVLGDATSEVQLNAQVPDVGECITEASLFGSETEVVDCTAAEAAWEVIGNDGTWTKNDFDDTLPEEICAGFEGTEQMLWIGELTADGTGDGEVVCLVSVVQE